MEKLNKSAEQEDFSYEGFQVIRREFFAHLREPAISMKYENITFNTACISKLTAVKYIQLLINPEKRKLVIRPCDEDDKDAIRWCIVKEDIRKSRTITCRLFAAKIFDMLGWDNTCRYKLLGSFVEYGSEKLFVFDLMDTEVYLPNVPREDGSTKTSKKQPRYPEAWRESFGLPVNEHKNSLNVDLLDGYARFDTSNKIDTATKDVPASDKRHDVNE